MGAPRGLPRARGRGLSPGACITATARRPVFGAFPIFENERNGKTIREDTGETALLQFTVNDVSGSALSSDYVHAWGGLDVDVFLQPQAKGEIAGLPRFDDALVVARDTKARALVETMDKAALRAWVR